MGKKSQVTDTSSNKFSEPPYRPEGYRDYMVSWSREFMDDWINSQKSEAIRIAGLEAAELERREAEKAAAKEASQRLSQLLPAAPAAPEQLLSTPPPDETPEQRVRRLAGEVFRLHRALERKIPERNKALLAFQAQTGKSYQQVADIAHMSKTTTFRIINNIRVGSDEPF